MQKDKESKSMLTAPPEDNRVLCPFCMKKFAVATAERHVPLCEAKQKDLKLKQAL